MKNDTVVYQENQITEEGTVIKNKVIINEDWTVVLLGGLIILLALMQFVLPVPAFGWKNSGDLFSKVVALNNLVIMFTVFLFVLVIAAIGAWLTGKNVKSFVLGFPIVYVITILALIIAGNRTIKGFNLEAVIFSLSLGLIIG